MMFMILNSGALKNLASGTICTIEFNYVSLC